MRSYRKKEAVATEERMRIRVGFQVSTCSRPRNPVCSRGMRSEQVNLSSLANSSRPAIWYAIIAARGRWGVKHSLFGPGHW